MKTLLTIALAALAFAEVTHAQDAEQPRGFDAFRLVRARNIFDPNRQPSRTSEAPRRSASPGRSRPNFLGLTGTMVTPAKSLAFFSGAGSDSSKVASVGESIADYKVTSIAPGKVELTKGGAPTTLAVGNQLSLEGSIALPPSAEPATTAAPTAASTDAPPTAAPAPPSSNSNEDVLRRLTERRQKEITK